jgi:hypothetical protein
MNLTRTFRRFLWLVSVGWLAALGLISAQAAPALATGSAAVKSTAPDPIAELHVGKDVYYGVRVVKVTATSLVIAHRDGVGSILLADLPPDWQKKFGYDPARAAAEAARLQAATEARKIQVNAAPGDKRPPQLTAQQILQRFGQPPKIFAEVNMQPRFDHLGISAKNQGARPSCAVFALVSALEYQSATAEGPAPEYSEEYLIWATLKVLGKIGVAVPKSQEANIDIGFALGEVAEAVRAYGLAMSDDLPYHFTLTDPHIIEPSTEIIERAKKRTPANGYYITGREPAAQIANIIQVLDAGVPVVAGIKWPEQKAYNDNVVLDEQPAVENSGHAILLVGYRTKTGKLADLEFLFKNSYGEKWGDNGYGIVSYRYLVKNLQDALFLEVR